MNASQSMRFDSMTEFTVFDVSFLNEFRWVDAGGRASNFCARIGVRARRSRCIRWSTWRDLSASGKQAALLMVTPLASSKKNRYRLSLGLFVQNQSMSTTAYRSTSTLQAALDRNNRRAFWSESCPNNHAFQQPTASVCVTANSLNWRCGKFVLRK